METLTEIHIGLNPASINRWLKLQASNSAHSPNSSIKPHYSATGMNSSGETKPTIGEFKRINASHPIISPVLISACG